MTVGQYIKYTQIQEEESLTQQQKSAALVSMMRGIDVRDLRKKVYSEVQDIVDSVVKELEDIGNFKFEDHPVLDEYIIDGEKYYLMKTINMMTAIQYSDLINVIKMGDNRVIDKNLHTILSIMLVPDGARYPDYNRFEVEEKIMEHFNIADGMAIANFCRGLSDVSHHNILTSLVLNETTAWTMLPKWRRIMARTLIKAALMPRRKHLRQNGGLLFGSIKSQKSKTALGQKQKDLI